MKTQRLALALTMLNLVLLSGIVLSHVRAADAAQDVVPMLRGRGLQIVDSLGRVRASISILPSSGQATQNRETVLLRLINSRGGPIVKIGAGENGAGMALTDGSRAFNGVQILAIDTGTVQVKVHRDDTGERVLKP